MVEDILAKRKKVNVLVVDDRPDGLVAIEAVLSSDYHLVSASSGQEALSYLFQYEFALILLDVQMPGMDGFETARIIKDHGDWKHIPIVFLTAINKDIAHIYKGYECGAVDYLFKPFDPWVLKSKVGVFAELFLKNQMIKEQSKLLSSTNKALQIEMAERMKMQKEILEVRDREQKRIGQDLHDGLAQQLAAISFVGKVLQRKLETQGNPEAFRAGEIMELVRNSIYETKRIARGFYPIELEKHGLFSALQELAINTQKQFRVVCECQFDDSTQIDDKDFAIHLYRISQEAVHNAIKHGQAKRILISSGRSNGHIHFSVYDDGRGIENEAVAAAAEGMGIRNMNYRAKMIGASLSIERQEGGGTVVNCVIHDEAMNMCKGD